MIPTWYLPSSRGIGYLGSFFLEQESVQASGQASERESVPELVPVLEQESVQASEQESVLASEPESGQASERESVPELVQA